MRITRLLLLLFVAFSATAGDEPNVLTLGDATPAEAKIGDLAWIEGHWAGPGLGAQAEEIWSAPEAGAMMGVFRLVRQGKTSFYEIMTLAEDGDSVTLRLKHFHPDLKGWEEKDEVVTFHLVKLEPRRAWFDGLTFDGTEDGALRVWVRIRNRTDGTSRDEAFVYTRR